VTGPAAQLLAWVSGRAATDLEPDVLPVLPPWI
jgi:hypothetical protein